MDNDLKAKKKKRRSPAMTAALVALVVLMILITTLAMFTSRDLITNRFGSGKLDIVLIEPNWRPSNGSDILPGDDIPKNPMVQNADKTNAYIFLKVTVPCAKLKLDDTKGNKFDTSSASNSNSVYPLYKFVAENQDPKSDDDVTSFEQVVNKQWVKMNMERVSGFGLDSTNNTYTYLYAYKGSQTTEALELLAPDKTTAPLFDSLKVSNFSEENFDTDTNTNATVLSYAKSYNVNIEAYAIQAEYLENGEVLSNNPEAVWNRIKQN